MYRKLDSINRSLKSDTPISAIGKNPSLDYSFPLSPENPEKSGENRVEIEGIPKGGKRRVRPRIPRKVLQAGNKYDISVGKYGFFRCPHLGIYCSCGSARDIQNCRGGEDCTLRDINPFIDRLWHSYNASKSNCTPIDGGISGNGHAG